MKLILGAGIVFAFILGLAIGMAYAPSHDTTSIWHCIIPPK